jgi:uncharacterized protein YdeI (BOF family)
MQTQLISAGVALATMMVIPSVALSQNSDRTPSTPTTASSIREIQTANSTTLAGQIIRISGDDFILDDGTGQILVEAESRPLRRAKLAAGETVTVVGHLDENELEAYRIIRANGEEIYIFDD